MARKPIKQRDGLSMTEIMRGMPLDPDIRNAKHVSLYRGVSSGYGPRARTAPKVAVRTVTSIPGESPRAHVVTVTARDPDYRGKLTRSPAVKVSCTCERFKFMWEYALHYHGAADIVHSNGEPPVEKNPRLAGGACKHAYRAFQYIRRNGL